MSQNSNYIGATTGSIATATSLAALQFILYDEPIDNIIITTPNNELDILIDSCEKITPNKAMAISHKYPYNDPDVTVDLDIVSTVELVDFKGQNIIIEGGEGVGTVTKKGLQIGLGEPAINPVPQRMIVENLKPLVPSDKTAVVTISVPLGRKIAKKTMNPKLGIVGGISILGTTGIARSMSSQAYKDSIVKQIDVAIANGIENPIFVPGNIGEKLAVEMFDVKSSRIIQTGNYVGFMFEEAKKRGYDSFTFFGHIGKLIKVAGGIFNTKHSVADARREIMITHSALIGASTNTLRELFNAKTTEEMLEILNKNNLQLKVCNSISKAIHERCRDRFDLDVNVVLSDMDGNFLNDNFSHFK